MLPLRKKDSEKFIFIALGANLAGVDGVSAVQTCERALRAMANLPGLYAPIRSRWFSSAAIPRAAQPRYINGVIKLQGTAAPRALLSCLQDIEARAGRVRAELNGARTLDLDIIDMPDPGPRQGDPLLPHPRAHLRGFVLLPLRDVAPNWVHPSSGLPIQTLIDQLPPQDIHPL